MPKGKLERSIHTALRVLSPSCTFQVHGSLNTKCG